MNPVELPDEQVPKLAPLAAYELEEAPTCLAVSDDGELVAVGSILDEVILCSSELKVLHILPGHDGGSNSLCFTSTGILVSAGEDGTVKFWDPKSGTLIQSIACEGVDVDKTPSGHTVTHLDVGNNGTLVVCACGRTVHTFDVAKKDELGFPHQKYPPVDCGAIEQMRCIHKNLILAAHNGGLTWFRSTPSMPSTFLPYGAAMMCLDATTELQWMVGGTHDASLHIWNFVEDGGEMAGNIIKSGSAGSRDQKGAAAGTSGGKNKSSSGEGEGSGLSIVELSCGGYSTKVMQCRFDPGQTRLASSGGPHCTVWDFSAEGPAGSVPVITLGHTKPVECLSWQRIDSSQRQHALLASGARDGRVMVYDVWDFVDNMPKLCLPVGGGKGNGAVGHVCWGKARKVYSTHQSGEVCCWESPADAEPPAPTPVTSAPPLPARPAGPKQQSKSTGNNKKKKKGKKK